MANTLVVGMQWGDEGKGKLVDILAEDHEVIARFQGGGNAGHTVVIDKRKYVLHQLPSGILSPGKINIIGQGTVIDPEGLLKEINALENGGFDVNPKNLMISNRASITLEHHKILDEIQGGKIGTTKKGIGPTYVDNVARTGVSAGDLFDKKRLEERVSYNLLHNNIILKHYSKEEQSVKEVCDGLVKVSEKLMQFIRPDIQNIILKYDDKLLFEGAQGTLLDCNCGTYPYVTSSNTTRGGAITGSGVHVDFNNVIGILKAYTTRVGEGPFPTEQKNEVGNKLQEVGGEFGATTGRPRRCGYLDLFAADYAIKVNGINKIFLTKLDVLDNEYEIKVCTGYKLNGKKIDYFPMYLDKCTPIYKELQGWKASTKTANKFSDLPRNAQEYVKFVRDYLNTNICGIGIGPARNQTIFTKDL